MDSNDPIQSDASTVHRGDVDPPAVPPSVSPQPAVSSGSVTASGPSTPVSPSGKIAPVGELEAAAIAEAGTVIRDSSRINTPGSKSGKRFDQTPASVAKVLMGSRLNHFLLEELIGGGGMGAVFRGT